MARPETSGQNAFFPVRATWTRGILLAKNMGSGVRLDLASDPNPIPSTLSIHPFLLIKALPANTFF